MKNHAKYSLSTPHTANICCVTVVARRNARYAAGIITIVVVIVVAADIAGTAAIDIAVDLCLRIRRHLRSTELFDQTASRCVFGLLLGTASTHSRERHILIVERDPIAKGGLVNGPFDLHQFIIRSDATATEYLLEQRHRCFHRNAIGVRLKRGYS